jgi:hypothetical protein
MFFKVLRTCDETYRTVDDALEKTIPLDVLDIIIGYTRYDKTHFHIQLLHQVDQNQAKRTISSDYLSPCFERHTKHMLKRMTVIKGRLNKMYYMYMFLDYVCDFHFLINSPRFLNIVKQKLNFFYNTEKLVNVQYHYRLLFDEEISGSGTCVSSVVKRKLCSLCRLPGHTKSTCERVDLFDTQTQ